MPRLPRVYIEGMLYYVTSKSGHNQDIFVGKDDYKEYLELISRYKKQHGFKLFAYILLPKHIHLLIEVKNNVGISNIMHDINSIYTKIFNGKYSRKGHLFQSRYRAVFAHKETYLLPLLAHIHFNSRRIGFVEEICDYSYSSHINFLNPEKNFYFDMKDEINEVFSILDSRNQTYEGYIKEMASKDRGSFAKAFSKKRILGPVEFVKNVNNVIEDTLKNQNKPQISKKKHLLYMRFSLSIVLAMLIGIIYFYRQNTALKSEYDITFGVYQRTLDLLVAEKSKALLANESIDDYEWKIRLTEQALKELQERRLLKNRTLKIEKELEGYLYKINIRQVSLNNSGYNFSDIIYIFNRKIKSQNFMNKGYSPSNYSKRMLSNGVIVWETIQRNDLGETASWRGEWNGKSMKGILRIKEPDGSIKDFSFKSLGKRVRIKE